MPSAERDEMTRNARRWADVAWAQGWYAHAIDVLDKAIELSPRSYKLYRKRGAFYLLCPDPKIHDDEQGVADLRRACELVSWREDFVHWVTGFLSENGEPAAAKEIAREQAKRTRKPAAGEA